MCSGAIVVEALRRMLKGWDFPQSDGRGLLGGLLTSWKEDLKGHKLNFIILNLYGPYYQK